MDEIEYDILVTGIFSFRVKAPDRQSADALAATQLQNVLNQLDGCNVPDEDEGGLCVTEITEA